MPRAVEAIDTQKLQPLWRVSRLEVVEPYGFQAITSDGLRSLHAGLASREVNTWEQLLVQNQKHNHAIEVGKLCAKARKRLKELNIDEESLMSMRLGSTRRLWGIRDGQVFHLLFWDPKHLIYKTKPHNT